MVSPHSDIEKKQVHPEAEVRIRQYVSDFATSLLLQARLLAHEGRDSIVLSRHVERAASIIKKAADERGWIKDLFIAVGGAFFGTFLQGFVGELSAIEVRRLVVTIYTVFGFVGMLMVVWGLRR